MLKLWFWRYVVQKALPSGVIRLVLDRYTSQILVWGALVEASRPEMSIMLLSHLFVILIVIINWVLRFNLMVSPNVNPLICDRIQHIDVWNNHVFLDSTLVEISDLRKISLVSLISHAWRVVQKNPWVWRSPGVILTLKLIIIITRLSSVIWVFDDRRVHQWATVVPRVAGVVYKHILLASASVIYRCLILTAVESTRMVEIIIAHERFSRLLKGLRLLNEPMVCDRRLLSLV